MDNWKPYLHTSLFGTFPEGGEPFLFPSFIVDSTGTYLGSAVFTFAMGLAERTPSHRPGRSRPYLRTLLFFLATLLRYLLMIISMGMDWFLLLTIVSSLSLGQLLIELRRSNAQSGAGQGGSRARGDHVLLREVEIDDADADDAEDEHKALAR
ncbi:uncharacterized protein PSFLO_01885 [Pseudozyma flocculosa]|uniref:Copper transporter n=1 Tax=Pseudozyma flocculosa TaxID=84751 RepID=A0A5C3EVX2_9BASI|nr:uncharacterized protein PSFLO_01885 [Pseudozyma flocculosa]